ncbi:MAG: histidine kinase dimerization/phosphoacceptor domain -containing protein [Saprospiraceae bacterium]
MKPLFLLLFLNFSIALSLYAQSVIDSLRQLLTTELSPAEYVSNQTLLINQLKTINKKAALNETRELIQSIDNQLDKEKVANIYILAGEIYLDNSVMDSTSLYLQKAIEKFTELDKAAGVGEAQLIKITQAIRASNTDEATTLGFNILEAAQARGDKEQEGRALNKIADSYSYASNFEKGIEYWKRAIDLQKLLEVPEDLASSYMGLAYDYLFTGEYDLALNNINTAIDLLKKEQLPELTFSKYMNARGNINKYLENWPEAIADYEANLRISQSADYPIGQILSYANLGHVYKLQQKYDEALSNSLQAIKLMEETGERSNLEETYWHTAETYAGKNQYVDAYTYAIKYADEMEQSFQEVIQQIETEQDQKYALAEQGNLIAYQQVEIKQQQRIQWLTGGILVLLATLLAVGIWAWRKQKQSNELLNTTNQNLTQKNKENEILMKEIHHRVKNNLQMIASLLSLQSMHIEDETAFNAVQASQKRVESVGILHKELYSRDDITQVKMNDYLPVLTENLEDAFLTDGRITIEHEIDPIELDVETAIPVGLIVNELVTNALKYAFSPEESGEIRVKMREMASQNYRLEVQDTGSGFTENTEVEGTNFGTKLIEILANQLQATLTKESSDEDFTITLEWKSSLN